MESSGNGDGRWPVWLLSLVSYPFMVGAVATNVFFASLIGQSAGWETVIAPIPSILISLVLGIPAAWITGRWFREKIDEAEGYSDDEG
ncbi:hypothetical protein SAMN04488527_11513 [Aliiroseovarius crassostreae]|uniref:NnrT protein n=1 Tax=Aliiroseovarius crassostreae TaxID=154981 RepID=A0A0P7J827_9RHOB|nr:hypothetical protein [Aliiroseovarius crassostreae]KPN64746.1 hypothetical protein AKJ29_05750 [Aliiroseovarius crassostreae]SFU76421.1 hypothetical protein SAMN04488527_11513 [Aliiroseovarius crassostreae]